MSPTKIVARARTTAVVESAFIHQTVRHGGILRCRLRTGWNKKVFIASVPRPLFWKLLLSYRLNSGDSGRRDRQPTEAELTGLCKSLRDRRVSIRCDVREMAPDHYLEAARLFWDAMVWEFLDALD